MRTRKTWLGRNPDSREVRPLAEEGCFHREHVAGLDSLIGLEEHTHRQGIRSLLPVQSNVPAWTFFFGAVFVSAAVSWFVALPPFVRARATSSSKLDGRNRPVRSGATRAQFQSLGFPPGPDKSHQVFSYVKTRLLQKPTSQKNWPTWRPKQRDCHTESHKPNRGVVSANAFMSIVKLRCGAQQKSFSVLTCGRGLRDVTRLLKINFTAVGASDMIQMRSCERRSEGIADRHPEVGAFKEDLSEVSKLHRFAVCVLGVDRWAQTNL